MNTVAMILQKRKELKELEKELEASLFSNENKEIFAKKIQLIAQQLIRGKKMNQFYTSSIDIASHIAKNGFDIDGRSWDIFDDGCDGSIFVRVEWDIGCWLDFKFPINDIEFEKYFTTIKNEADIREQKITDEKIKAEVAASLKEQELLKQLLEKYGQPR